MIKQAERERGNLEPQRNFRDGGSWGLNPSENPCRVDLTEYEFISVQSLQKRVFLRRIKSAENT